MRSAQLYVVAKMQESSLAEFLIKADESLMPNAQAAVWVA